MNDTEEYAIMEYKITLHLALYVCPLVVEIGNLSELTQEPLENSIFF